MYEDTIQDYFLYCCYHSIYISPFISFIKNVWSMTDSVKLLMFLNKAKTDLE